MILVDDRHPHPGPAHPAFCRRLAGLAHSARLDAGDLVWWDGAGARTAVIEVKRPHDDLVDSVVNSGRLVQQLRTARALFPGCTYTLVVEGGKYAGCDPEGDWAVRDRNAPGGWRKCRVPGSNPPRAVSYRRVVNFLNTLRFVEGVQVIDTASEAETAAYALALYHWWQKEPDEHTSTAGNRLYTPVWLGPSGEVPLVRRWATELPGVGIKRARAVAAVFDSPLALAEGAVADWARVEGVGKVTAERVWRAIRNLNGTGKGQGGS